MIGLINADIVSNGILIRGHNVVINGNIIEDITDKPIDIKDSIDCTGKVLAAGYIDIHTHGGYLYDVMDAGDKGLREISRYHLDTGTTTYLPTTLTASQDSILRAIDAVRGYCKDNKYSRIWGVHMEGPYFTSKNAGAQPPKYLLTPDDNNTRYIYNNRDIIKRISIAPDASGIIPYVKKFCEWGIQVSGGHDNSVDYEISACIDNGMSSITHLFNCTSYPTRRPLPHKYLGLTEIGLIDDRLYTELIMDNRHVPFPQFKIAYKMKGYRKILLVSDSLSISGMGDIKHYIGKEGEGYPIEVKDGVGIIPSINTYAGSVTPISKMVEILIKYYDIPIEEAAAMGALNQAKLLQIKDRGDIAKGMLADINILNYDGSIFGTIFNGELIARP